VILLLANLNHIYLYLISINYIDFNEYQKRCGSHRGALEFGAVIIRRDGGVGVGGPGERGGR
jgi:hypothetical protein